MKDSDNLVKDLSESVILAPPDIEKIVQIFGKPVSMCDVKVSAQYSRVLAREQALCDAQCLLQRALNETYGNPRDYEESDPAKTKKLFKKQRRDLAKLMDVRHKDIKKLFADGASMSVKDLAECLQVLGYTLSLDIFKTIS